MAVSNPDQINLAPFYGNIIDAIRARAQYESQRPPSTASQIGSALGKGLGGGIAAGAETALKEGTATRLAKLESNLDLNRQKDLFKYQSDLKNVLTDEEKRVNEEREKLAKSVEEKDPNLAQYIRAFGGTTQAAEIAGKKVAGVSTGKKTYKVKDPRTNEETIVDISDENNPKIIYQTGPSSAPDGQKRKFVNFNDAEQERILKYKTEFNSSPLIKGVGESISSLDQLKELLEKNPKGASGLIKTQMTILSGQTGGRLSDKDIALNEPNPDLAAKLSNAYNQMLEGDISAENISRYKKIVEIIDRKNKDKFNELINSSLQGLALTIPEMDFNNSSKIIADKFSNILYPHFDSVEKAEKANLKPGSKMYINGLLAVME